MEAFKLITHKDNKTETTYYLFYENARKDLEKWYEKNPYIENPDSWARIEKTTLY